MQHSGVAVRSQFIPMRAWTRHRTLHHGADEPSPSWPLYSPLDATRREIRLLQLVVDTPPNQIGESLIYLSMSVHNLDKKRLRFHALSYAWAELPGLTQIVVNDETLLVTNNLYEALRMFITTGALDRPIWVDAICINQQDPAERSHQVSFMRDVYTKAHTVRVWLGPDEDTSGKAFEHLIRAHGNERSDQFPHLDDDLMDRVEKVVMWSYWARLWVVQEATLATRAQAHLGDSSTPFRTLVKSLKEAISAVQGGGLTFFTPVISDVERFVQAERVNRKARDGSMRSRDVCSLIYESGPGLTSLKHDRIYALLGLLPPDLEIPVDYSVSIPKLYQRTMEQLALRTNSLNLLMYAGDCHGRDLDLPTWVPDFAQTDLYWSSLGSRWSADDGQESDHMTMFNDGRLEARCVTIGTLEWVRTPSPWEWEVVRFDGPVAFRTALLEWRQKLKERLGPTTPDHLLRVLFCRTVTHDTVNLAGGAWSHWTSQDDELAQAYDAWLYSNGEQRLTALMGISLRAAKKSKAFFTSSGHFGLVLEGSSCQYGDTVAILAGLTVPCLLRPVKGEASGVFKYITACHVDGIMRGEAVRAEAENMGMGEVITDRFGPITLI